MASTNKSVLCLGARGIIWEYTRRKKAYHWRSRPTMPAFRKNVRNMLHKNCVSWPKTYDSIGVPVQGHLGGIASKLCFKQRDITSLHHVKRVKSTFLPKAPRHV